VAGCSRASFFAAIFTGEMASPGAGNSQKPTVLRLIKTITIRSGCIGEEDLGQDSRLRTLRQCISVLVVEIKRKKYSLFEHWITPDCADRRARRAQILSFL
jgi:hypothetical protein